MQKSLDIFKAEPQSVFDVLCDRRSTGFYMPAYQRPYSWEETHIRDLFSDCDNVFRNLLESSDAIIFLGSILSVDDSLAKTVYPNVNRNPTHIKLIIDGQQRLTTLTLILLCLNEKLRSSLPKLKKIMASESDDKIKDALESLREIVLQNIKDTDNFSIETTAEHGIYKYLPKIIRSQVDCWGKDESKATYVSPVSEILIAYQKHIIENYGESSYKDFEFTGISESSKRVVNNVKEIRRQINCIANGFQFRSVDGEDSETLSVSDFLNVDTLEYCLDFPINEDLLCASQSHNKISEIVFVTLFTKFLLHRVCLTYVEVNNESYAFDMFEALNTTGEPLTAIETFVPKVIEYINGKKKDQEEGVDEAFLTLSSITNRFEDIIKSKEKNDKTKSLILAFIRAYEGKVKVTSLRDQRDAMLKSYDQCPFKDEYLNQLKKTADFLFDYWQSSVPNVSELVVSEERDVANVCIRYLVDMKHDIVQSLLVQFILQDEKYGILGTNDSSFISALKAVTAFSALWRAMSGGADGIDGVYKKLHERGFDVAGEHFKAYQLKESTLSSEEFNVDVLKKFFLQELESKIIDKESPKDSIFEKWLDISAKQPLLTNSKSIKFLILASFHGIKLEDFGFMRVNEPMTQFITPTMWELISNKDRIKKVFNGSSAADWTDQTIKNPEIFNKLGNILVDARDSIQTSGKQSWFGLKQSLLEALSNDSLTNINTILSSNISIEAKRNASVNLLESKYAEITYAEEWDKQAIEERTRMLLSNAWENLIQWLK